MSWFTNKQPKLHKILIIVLLIKNKKSEFGLILKTQTHYKYL